MGMAVWLFAVIGVGKSMYPPVCSKMFPNAKKNFKSVLSGNSYQK